MTQTTHGHHGVRGAGRRLALALGAASLLAVSLAAPAAHAALSRCSTDPVVTLSNGAQVTMSNDIYDASTNVTKVAYILHAPGGTTVTSVSYANSTTGIPETFTFYADNQPGDYDSYDAMTSDRPYRAGMPQAKAVSILRAGRGQQWDPTLVDAFLRALGAQEGLGTAPAPRGATDPAEPDALRIPA